MKNNFIPYAEALALKELGFDGECLVYYNKKELFSFNQTCNEKLKGHFIKMSNRLCTPLYQQAFKFFRDKYNLLGNVYSNASGYLWEIHDDKGGTHRFDSEYYGDELESGTFTTYEKAELACLQKLIEVC